MSYKVGDVIGKYTVTRDFDSANGGQCQWGFASYNGAEFFVKKFLNPVYPGEKSPGSEKGKQKKKIHCYEFETKQLLIQKALSACGDGGLVVRTVDFFRNGDEYGSHYFKVSQKVDTSSLSAKVHTLSPQKRLFVMLTAAGALKILHTNKIIHLDLKPDNILIQQYESNLVAKIIDFDSSMIEGESTIAEYIVGDAVYYSPEVARYISTNSETPPPTNKSDIFSLGLIFCQYWTGRLPAFSNRYTYPHEAVLNGESLAFQTADDSDKNSRINFGTLKPHNPKTPIEAGIFKLISHMLVLEPEKRLSVNQVHQTLKHFYHQCKPNTETDKISPIDEKKTRIRYSNNFK